jgi:thiol:disulfide interchange protein
MNLRALLALAFLGVAVPASAVPVSTPHVEAELVAERNGWIAGSTNWVALRLQPEEGWHTYWRNPGDSGLPTTLAWTLPEGWKAGEISWPYPSRHKLGDLVNYGYDSETLHLVPVDVPAGAEGEVTIKALAKWLVCADICIPGQADVSLALPVSEIATADPVWAQRFADTRARLPQPEPLAGVFAVTDAEVRLQVDAVELAGSTSVEFYPYADDLVNHGAPQRVALSGSVARFAQDRSAAFAEAPATVDGVVVVQGSSEKYAYTVSAAPGEVDTVAAPPPPAAPPAPAADAAVPDLWLALGFALLGGLILNLMPCVFPVLSIKAISVLESRRGDRKAERLHALAYTGGAVLSCAAVALAIVLLREGGEQLGWGFQLQAPLFVAVLAYVVLALGLSLSGVVQFGTRLMGVGQGLVEQGGYTGSFFTGVLAVVVASPCTAPFMGTALGFALTQPLHVAVLVFATLGLGLALPFLLLGLFPALGAWLPRPGAWMETFKQVMAFPLYLTVVWLLWVLGRQAGGDAVAIVMCGLVALAFALWLWSGGARLRRALALLAGLGAFAFLAHPAVTAPVAPMARPATVAVGQASKEPYSDARLQELRAAGRIVFVNFTADWCITCKVNEKVALGNERVLELMAEKNVAWLEADWTTPDPAITAALGRFGRSGVPLYLLYGPEGEPEILPQILTPDSVIEAVNWVSSQERK